MRTTLALAIAGAIWLTPLGARANMAAPPPDQPAQISGILAEKTPLAVEHERLVFRCGPVSTSGEAIQCSFEATYQIHNPTAQPIDQVAAFVGLRTPRVDVAVDGRDARTALSPEKSAAIAALVPPAGPRELGERSLHGLSFHVAAGQRVTITARGTALPGLRGHQSGGYVLSANKGRHLLLGEDEHSRPPREHLFHYLVSPIHSWGAVGRIDIELYYDDSFDLQGGLHTTTRGVLPWNDAGDGVARITTSGRDGGTLLEIELVDHPFPILHGGPMVAIGGIPDGGSEFRMRFGYEIAGPDYLQYGVYADTNFEDTVIVAPMVEIMSPHVFFIFPSFAFGLGAPFRIHEERVDAGIRLQGTLGLLPIGFVTSIDIFPTVDAPHRVDASLLARFSL